ncbi:wax ester/triacylglycerol synthase family O-acyltransferase [Oryzihumus sp.]|jgi:WS/DGAT/MGAT family acyltransferase|uniref:wax ester/triacylglycerol synthase family O-acyltransferase n=1 Tax=Oryzihumus sp. TaxID=1968903 RepID=UPI002ED89DD7
MSGRRRIGPVDTIWLNMDRPNNLMVIESVMFLDEAPDWDRLVDVVRRRMVERFPVFHQRPVPPRIPLGLPHWEDDPDFSLDRHVHRVTLPPPGDDAALQRLLEQQLHVPLDRAHPLWQVHLVDGYGSGAAVLCRFHHALADGIALTQVMLSLTDAAPDGDLAEEEGTVAHPRSEGLAGVADGALSAARAGGALARQAVTGILGLTTPSGVVGAAGQVLRAGQVVDDLLLTRTPDNPLSGTPGIHKRAVWSQPWPLADLKHVGRLAGATLNDVLLSAVAGALCRYQLDHGGVPADLPTMVPVNVRPLDQPLPRELGNKFALVFFTFPSSIQPPLERLAETKRRMDWLKRSPEATVTFGLITAIGRTTAQLEHYVVNFFADKVIGVTTNVAGPTSVRHLAGVRISGALGWVPGSGRQTLGVSIFTYADTLRVGFMADADCVREPEKLLHAVEREVADLMSVARTT